MQIVHSILFSVKTQFSARPLHFRGNKSNICQYREYWQIWKNCHSLLNAYSMIIKTCSVYILGLVCLSKYS